MMNNIKKFKWLVLAGNIILSVLFIILFNFMSYHYVKDNAIASLNQERESIYEQEKNFDVFHISESTIEDGSPYLVENELYNYLEENIAIIEFEAIYNYKSDTASAYFYATDDVDSDDPSPYYIYYVNTFPMNTIVRNVNIVLVITSFLSNVVIILVIFRTSRILEQNERNTKQFFANASHELKTPIMAIEGYTEGLEKELVSKEDAIKTIYQESERMKLLVNDILKISEVDNQGLKLELYKHDVREILYDVLSSLLPIATDKNIKLSPKLDKAIFINCDDKLIYSVFSNIIANNIRYAKTEVTIEYFYKNNHHNFIITDDGQLLSKAESSLIFERFHKGNQGQTGLGLALALEYIKLHHGMITYEQSNDLKKFIIKI